MVPQLQVVEHMPKKCLPINLFDICVRLYRCVKIWIVKIWRIFGQLSILSNNSSAKVSFHMVCIYFFTRLQNATEVDATCLLPPDPVVGYLSTWCHQLLTTRILTWILEGRVTKPKINFKLLNYLFLYHIHYYYAGKTTTRVFVHTRCYHTML